MDKKRYAENMPYWKSGKSQPESWILKAKEEIKAAGGIGIGDGFLDYAGQAAFMLTFRLGEDVFKVMWPVMESKTGNALAARRQAATMLYHDVKAKCVSARVLGVRKSFFSYLVLGDGRVVSDIGTSDLTTEINQYLLPMQIEAR